MSLKNWADVRTLTQSVVYVASYNLKPGLEKSKKTSFLKKTFYVFMF